MELIDRAFSRNYMLQQILTHDLKLQMQDNYKAWTILHEMCTSKYLDRGYIFDTAIFVHFNHILQQLFVH